MTRSFYQHMNLTLSGPCESKSFEGFFLRFENEGASALAFIRSFRPGFYANHRIEVRDSCGQIFSENRIVPCCGSPYPLTGDALIVLLPGGAKEVAVDVLGYRLPPGQYSLRVIYSTHETWLKQVTEKPEGFGHLARGSWESNWI